MAERHSEYTRDPLDHYIEPSWCFDALAARYAEDLSRGFHDPCCGIGTIPDRATALGFPATGADIQDRANGRFPVRDFMWDQSKYGSIAANPPFRAGVPFAERALQLVYPGGIVALICQAKFLFSQGRHPLFTRPEMERVIVFSRRPSMPSGKFLAEHGEAGRGGGSIDFVWCIWRVGKSTPGTSIEWTL